MIMLSGNCWTCLMNRARYDARGMVPDPDRLADAEHTRRAPVTDEISWPPADMAAMLRNLKLIGDKDPDT